MNSDSFRVQFPGSVPAGIQNKRNGGVHIALQVPPLIQHVPRRLNQVHVPKQASLCLNCRISEANTQ